MPITVVKNNSGSFYQSGPISFSSIRNNFSETYSGQVRISDYRRNTNRYETNTIVPDSTENENISTGNNLRIGGFRNSVKRYFAIQSGEDNNNYWGGSNSDPAAPPGLRLGRVDENLRGIDWSGGGYGGRDGQAGPDQTNSNVSRNIQKIIYITGTCGSRNPSRAAAQLSPGTTGPYGQPVEVHNVTIYVQGSILGASGEPSGGGGGAGLRIVGTSNCRVIMDGGRIYGGGGAGATGANGANGPAGLCWSKIPFSNSECGACPPNGGIYYTWQGVLYFQGNEEWCRDTGECCREIESCSGGKDSVCVTRCDATTFEKYGSYANVYSGSTPAGGDGGVGGYGQGYNYSRTNGGSGSRGQGSTCPDLTGFITYGEDGLPGGDGGDWGEYGGNGGGRPGPAIFGTNYSVSNVNSSNIKGLYNAGDFDG
jgi:hypothetical protein